jgi:hypothetical protein
VKLPTAGPWLYSGPGWDFEHVGIAERFEHISLLDLDAR